MSAAVPSQVVRGDANTGGVAVGVASAHPLATQAGIDILKQGGNAFDAAVAISAVLAVVEPAGSGLGGGGFWLLHDAQTQQAVMLDGRERAPLAASRDMYLDENAEVIPRLSIDGGLAAGIPGEPAALAWLSKHRGRLPLATSLAPAITLAGEGFAVGERYRRLIGFRKDAILASPAAAEIFLDEGEVPEVGSVIVQKDLANTLVKLAEQGRDGFYEGEIAQKLVAGVNAAGGIWSLEDLSSYEVAVRKPIVSRFHDMSITSAALPSSGGLVLTQSLNILSGWDLSELTETEYTHLVVEAMRRAYRDRAEYMGDEDFVHVPVDMIISPYYASGLRQSIRIDKATPSHGLADTYHEASKGRDTTHFSVIDADGNRVAATLSINYPFGSGVVAPGTGVLLNDEMDDFSSKPGTANAYGLVGAQANAIAPGKRMLSSMTPTFLETGDRVAVVGTPGGSRIISMVLLAALEFYQNKSARQIVDRPRFHHQYLPDRIQFEPDALSEQTLTDLTEKGHTLSPRTRTWGDMHMVILDKTNGQISAASDTRGEGRAAVVQIP